MKAFALLTSIGLRAWIQHGDNMSPKMGKALALLTVTFVANMGAYFHMSINRFHLGLLGLLLRFLVLYVQHFGVVGVGSLAALALVGRYGFTHSKRSESK